jgi:hypothetical protein
VIYKKPNWLTSYSLAIKYVFILFIMVFGQIIGCTADATIQTGVSHPEIDVKSEIHRIAKPFALPLASWELENILRPVDNSPAGKIVDLPKQIEEVLRKNDVPIIPPVYLRLIDPPNLLVISPRDKILYADRLMLIPGLSTTQIQSLEFSLDALNISSLVTDIGGFGGAYPSIVSPHMPVKATINAASEEWAHQFLALRPLGCLYLLDSIGISQDPDVINMNETLAGIIAEEVGDTVYKDYYEGKEKEIAKTDSSAFDFNSEMHLTRVTVDKLLSKGEVSEAEKYMEQRRIYINSHGYYIRKINQAYFAYHGIYGQDPGTISPVYSQMIRLRNASASFSGFINQVAGMTKYSDLQQAINNLP